jgi:hypothetical protein
MTVIKMPDNPCPFCKRNEATQLCDFVVDYMGTIFFSPRDGGIMPPHPQTCDNQICKECAVKYNGHEFCPECKKIHEMVKRNRKIVGKRSFLNTKV